MKEEEIQEILNELIDKYADFVDDEKWLEFYNSIFMGQSPTT